MEEPMERDVAPTPQSILEDQLNDQYPSEEDREPDTYSPYAADDGEWNFTVRHLPHKLEPIYQPNNDEIAYAMEITEPIICVDYWANGKCQIRDDPSTPSLSLIHI